MPTEQEIKHFLDAGMNNHYFLNLSYKSSSAKRMLNEYKNSFLELGGDNSLWKFDFLRSNGVYSFDGTKIKTFHNIDYLPAYSNRVNYTQIVADRVLTIKNYQQKLNDVSKLQEYINSTKTISIARFLRSLLPEEYKDNVVRDFASFIESQLDTTKYQLIKCSTPEEATESHTCKNTGCFAIQYPKGKEQNRIYVRYPVTEIYNELGLWPSIWYLYVPNFTYCYVKNSHGALCRFPVYGNRIGSIKYSNIGDQQAITSLINKEFPNYKRYEGTYTVTIPFDVPITEYKGKKYCPHAIHDDIAGYYGMCFIKNKDVFRFGPCKYFQEKNILYTQMCVSHNWAGWIPSDKVAQYEEN